MQQNSQRVQNHQPSERAKVPLGKTNAIVPISIGDLVHPHADRYKNRVRDRYLVVSVDGNWCNLRKFVGSQLHHIVSASPNVFRLNLVSNTIIHHITLAQMKIRTLI